MRARKIDLYRLLATGLVVLAWVTVDAQAQDQGLHRLRVVGNVQAAKKDGTVKEANYVSGPQELSQSAIDAVRQWVYRQTWFNGQPVEIDSTVSIIFTLGR